MRKEKYIKVKTYKGNTYFTVQFSYKQMGKAMTYSKSFNAADYDSPAQALNAACKHRDLKRAEMLTKGLPVNQKATVKDVFEASLEVYKRASGTNENMHKLFKKYFPQYENIDIKDVDDWLIKAHLESIKGNASDNVISRVFNLWKRICKTAKSRKLVHDIATDTVEKPTSTHISKERQKIYTDAETQKVIEALRSECLTETQAYNNSIMISMIIVCRYAGLRPQEVKGIHRNDVDLENNLLYIRRSIGADGIKIVKTKTSVRAIPMVDKVRTELISLMSFAETDYIFKFYGGYWPDADELSDDFRYYANLAGVKGWHLYSQRHVFDTELILAGVDPRTVMELMGHSNVNTTVATYARSNNAAKEKALEMVETGRKLS